MPKPRKIRHETVHHGITLRDDYHWLRDNHWPQVRDKEVLHYLEEENAYFHEMIAPIKVKEHDIFEELKGRVQEEDQSVPIKKYDYYYYSFIREGDQYQTYARKFKSMEADPEIILDQNQLAQGQKYYSLGNLSVSTNQKYLAYSLDLEGYERYSIHIKDLETGELLPDVLRDVNGEVIWHESNHGFFYIKLDEHLRANALYYHELGGVIDRLIYWEEDPMFRVIAAKTANKDYVIFSAQSSSENEKYYLDARTADFTPKLILGRRPNILYTLCYKDGYFYIRINDKGENCRVIKVPLHDPSNPMQWVEIFPHNPHKYLEAFFAFKDFFVLESRIGGLTQIELFDNECKHYHTINFQDEAYEATIYYTTYYDPCVRFTYSSLKSPQKVMECNAKTLQNNVLKEQQIPCGFDSELYHLERKMVRVSDGVQVPLTILYRKDKFHGNGTNQTYLYGYGSYGIGTSLNFRASIFSLVDRGFVYAIASIRGGDELGFEWYTSAKFTNKKRTFYDFIDCAEYMIDEKYTAEKLITISGGSAGGMLVGFCINERPDLYKAAVMNVPFVDVLNTMLDETLPLTPGEFKEWGNPKEKHIFEYMLSYSPYDNIRYQEYPHVYITAGLSDPRVTYWEPAKFTAKLREYKLGNSYVLLHTDMSSGHQGKSGRYDTLKELAEEYNIIINLFADS